MQPLRKSSASRRAFTLVEMLAAVLLSALLAGSTAVGIAGLTADSRMRDVVSRLVHCDRLARQAAARFGPLDLQIDPASGAVAQVTGSDESRATHVMYRMPAGFEIRRLRIGGDEAFGTVSVRMGAAGTSHSYAVEVVAGGKARWLVFAGLSGQAIEAEDEREADQLLQPLAARDGAR